MPAEYNNLKKYLEYIEYCRSIDIPRMQVEIENVEKILIPSLLGEPLAKRLYKLACFTRNLENLFKIQLAPGGAEDLSKNLNENLTEEYLFFLKDVFYHLEIKKPRDFENRMAVLLKQSKENLKFYEIAERRDKVILQNTIKAMRSEKKQVAALITGGHHSEGLTRLMKKEQLSYMVLMPKFEDGKSRPYAAILTRKSGRYKKIAENDGYNLAIKTYFDSGSMSGIKESLVFSLGASFFDGRNIDDTRRLWTANYEREYNAIPKIRRDAMNVSPIAPEIFKNELYKIKIKLLGNGETCEVKCGNNIYVLKKDSFEMSCVRAVSDSNFSVAVKQVFEKLNIFLALARKKINKYFIGIKGAILSVVFFTHELFLKGEYRDLFRSIFSKHVRVVFITVLTAFLIVAPSLKELLFFNMFKKEYSAEANEYSRDTTPRWVKMISIINFNSEYPYKIRDFFKGTRAVKKFSRLDTEGVRLTNENFTKYGFNFDEIFPKLVKNGCVDANGVVIRHLYKDELVAAFGEEKAKQISKIVNSHKNLVNIFYRSGHFGKFPYEYVDLNNSVFVFVGNGLPTTVEFVIKDSEGNEIRSYPESPYAPDKADSGIDFFVFDPALGSRQTYEHVNLSEIAEISLILGSIPEKTMSNNYWNNGIRNDSWNNGIKMELYLIPYWLINPLYKQEIVGQISEEIIWKTIFSEWESHSKRDDYTDASAEYARVSVSVWEALKDAGYIDILGMMSRSLQGMEEHFRRQGLSLEEIRPALEKARLVDNMGWVANPFPGLNPEFKKLLPRYTEEQFKLIENILRGMPRALTLKNPAELARDLGAPYSRHAKELFALLKTNLISLNIPPVEYEKIPEFLDFDDASHEYGIVSKYGDSTSRCRNDDERLIKFRGNDIKIVPEKKDELYIDLPGSMDLTGYCVAVNFFGGQTNITIGMSKSVREKDVVLYGDPIPDKDITDSFYYPKQYYSIFMPLKNFSASQVQDIWRIVIRNNYSQRMKISDFKKNVESVELIPLHPLIDGEIEMANMLPEIIKVGNIETNSSIYRGGINSYSSVWDNTVIELNSLSGSKIDAYIDFSQDKMTEMNQGREFIDLENRVVKTDLKCIGDYNVLGKVGGILVTAQIIARDKNGNSQITKPKLIKMIGKDKKFSLWYDPDDTDHNIFEYADKNFDPKNIKSLEIMFTGQNKKGKKVHLTVPSFKISRPPSKEEIEYEQRYKKYNWEDPWRIRSIFIPFLIGALGFLITPSISSAVTLFENTIGERQWKWVGYIGVILAGVVWRRISALSKNSGGNADKETGMDSRFRGNDIGRDGNDIGRDGNDIGRDGNDIGRDGKDRVGLVSSLRRNDRMEKGNDRMGSGDDSEDRWKNSGIESHSSLSAAPMSENSADFEKTRGIDIPKDAVNIIIGITGISAEKAIELNKYFGGVKILALALADEKNNIKNIEKERGYYNAYASFIIDRQGGASADSSLEELIREVINKIEQDEKIKSFQDNCQSFELNERAIDEIQSRLKKVLDRFPVIQSRGITSLNVYEYKFSRIMPHESVVSNNKILSLGLTRVADNNAVKVADFYADSLVELKWIIDEHRKFIAKYAKGDKNKFPIKLHIRLNDARVNEDNLQPSLEKLGVADIITADEISLKSFSDINEIFSDISAKKTIYGEVKPSDVVICGKEDALVLSGKKLIDENLIFVNIRSGVSAQTYQPVVELLVNNNNIPAIGIENLKITRINKNGIVYLVFEPIKPVDIEKIRKEIDDYEKILIAA
ncbi:membrane protein [Candidatus Omnitrophus magneticus]|uniref:Membrane protein n=1 Tax=Candidatus Omnitrophus magneticus TaxID=1609969 RepID=A0A0F0CS56_9BACT|nr:membrane protein [Candidatus Omnitrophus magneticus]